MFKALRITLIVLLVLVQSVHAQEGVRELTNFRVLLRNGDRREGKNGRLTEDSLEWMMKNRQPMTVPREEIRALDESRGSEAMKYGAIGAGIGLLTALTAALWASAAAADDPSLEFKGGAAIAVTAGFTIGGGLIGAAIGASQKRWERIPIKTSLYYDRYSKQGVCVISIPF
jgi:hypothetical protein